MDVLYRFAGQLLLGAELTVALALVSIAVGCILGGIGVSLKLSGVRPLVLTAEIYTTLIRGLPDLLVILIVYFGGSVLLSQVTGRYFDIDPFAAGCAALAFIFGAFATEIFRGAILAVPNGQREAAQALGLRRPKTFLLVTLPQAARHAVSPTSNLCVVILKETSLVSVVGLEELMRKSSLAAGATKEPFIFYAAAAVLYFCLTNVLSGTLHFLEARSSRGLGA